MQNAITLPFIMKNKRANSASLGSSGLPRASFISLRFLKIFVNKIDNRKTIPGNPSSPRIRKYIECAVKLPATSFWYSPNTDRKMSRSDSGQGIGGSHIDCRFPGNDTWACGVFLFVIAYGIHALEIFGRGIE